MLKFLQNLYIKANIIANSFKRESDNSEVAYDNDLHSVAKSGDYTELSNKPTDTIEAHDNTYHSEEYDTVTGTQNKADSAEASANTYTDNREDVLELKLRDTREYINQIESDYNYQRQLLFSYYLDNDVQSVLDSNEAGYWYSPLTSIDNGLNTVDMTVMDARLKAISDHHISKYKNFDTRYSDLDPAWWEDD